MTNVDINVVVREYEKTIRELGVRLVNYAMQTAALQQRIADLEKQEKKPEEKKE